MNRLVIFLVSLCISNYVFADWVEVSNHKDGMTFYVDTESIRVGESDQRMFARSKMDNASVPIQHWEKTIYTMYEYDCGIKRFRMLDVLSEYYDFTKDKTWRETEVVSDKDWKYPMPGSIGNALLNFVCSIG